MKIGGQGVEVVSGAGPAGGAEAAAVVGDHPVSGGEQGGFLFFPRVPVQRVPVDQDDRGTGPVIFVVDPDSGCVLPSDSHVRHAVLAVRARSDHAWPPVLTVASGGHRRYPLPDCTWPTAGMPRPRPLLSLETALVNALAERTGLCQAPVNFRHSRPPRSLAGMVGWPGCADWWIRSRRPARCCWSPVRRGWGRTCCWATWAGGGGGGGGGGWRGPGGGA